MHTQLLHDLRSFICKNGTMITVSSKSPSSLPVLHQSCSKCFPPACLLLPIPGHLSDGVGQAGRATVLEVGISPVGIYKPRVAGFTLVQPQSHCLFEANEVLSAKC